MEGEINKDDRNLIKNYFADIFHEGEIDYSQVYDKVSDVYDKVNDIIGFNRVRGLLVNDLCQRFACEDLSTKVIIDIGCCTGPVGEILAKNGFKHIHGLELSKKALKICEDKNIYTKLFNVPLTADPIPDIVENTYDAAVSVGCFVEGHIPMNGLRELVRIVKPGGFITYTLHDPRYTKDYMAIYGELIKEGLVELQLMQLVPYKREIKKNFEWVNGYLVAFRVL